MIPNCVRCEALDRKQQHPHVQYVKVSYAKEKVPLCDVCIAEIAEEELFLKMLSEEQGQEDES